MICGTWDSISAFGVHSSASETNSVALSLARACTSPSLLSQVALRASVAKLRRLGASCPLRANAHASERDRGLEVCRSPSRFADEFPALPSLAAAWAQQRKSPAVARPRIGTGRSPQERTAWPASRANQPAGQTPRTNWRLRPSWQGRVRMEAPLPEDHGTSQEDLHSPRPMSEWPLWCHRANAFSLPARRAGPPPSTKTFRRPAPT